MTYENEYYEMNEKNNSNISHLKTLYTDTTKYIYTQENNEVLTSDKLYANHYRQEFHPSSVPVIVKDVTRPHTYYTMKSYGQAQDNNYYVNFDDHVTNGGNYNNYNNYNNYEREKTGFETNSKPTFEDTGCARTYLCSLLSCVACCLISFKPV